jgi:hypothetical protein
MRGAAAAAQAPQAPHPGAAAADDAMAWALQASINGTVRGADGGVGGAGELDLLEEPEWPAPQIA